MRKLTTPLTEEDVKSLHAGDHVLLSGVVYTCLLYTSDAADE